MPPATLIKKLGEGAFGKVYKGKYNGEDIAVKVIKLENAADEKMAVKEVKMLQRLKHTNIVKYKGGFFLPQNQQLHIYMELCNEGDLQGAINRMKTSGEFFPEGRILGWFRDVATAVQYLHSEKIIHRDIKPSNILLHNDCIKLGDFGLAKLLMSKQDIQASVIGTEIYACPEIHFENKCDNKGDMWSLGCTLFQLAALEPPFKNQSEISNFITYRSRLRDIPGHYSVILKRLIAVLLRKNPMKRPAATKVVEILNDIERSTPPVSVPAGDLSVAKRRAAEGQAPGRVRLRSAARVSQGADGRRVGQGDDGRRVGLTYFGLGTVGRRVGQGALGRRVGMGTVGRRVVQGAIVRRAPAERRRLALNPSVAINIAALLTTTIEIILFWHLATL